MLGKDPSSKKLVFPIQITSWGSTKQTSTQHQDIRWIFPRSDGDVIKPQRAVSFSDKTAEQQEFALTTNNQRLQLQPREMEGLLLSQHLQIFSTLDLFRINQWQRAASYVTQHSNLTSLQTATDDQEVTTWAWNSWKSISGSFPPLTLINTHRAQRSFSVVIASSSHCCNSTIRRVHAAVFQVNPLLPCTLVCVFTLGSREEVPVWGLCCERLQNDAHCPAEWLLLLLLLLTGANEGCNNGSSAGTQNRERGERGVGVFVPDLDLLCQPDPSHQPPSPLPPFPLKLYPSISPSQPVLFRSSEGSFLL